MVMRTEPSGDDTRPFGSKRIDAGAPVMLTCCATALRRLSCSAVATVATTQPCSQPEPVRAIETLTLRFNASLRASMRSDVRSYVRLFACCAARKPLNDGAMIPSITARTERTVISSTRVNPRSPRPPHAALGRGLAKAHEAFMAHQQLLRLAVLAPVWLIVSVPQRSYVWSVPAFG